MDFAAVFKFLIENFQREKIHFALIGGFALYVAGIARATRDIDLLISQKDVPKVKKLMLSHGYELLYESEDVSNYIGKNIKLGRVDFLHAHRRYSRAMLQRASFVEILEGRFRIKVLRIEDIIGLKVQSSFNDPERYHQDMSDIENLIRNNYKNLDMGLIREYFGVFDRGRELKNILRKTKDAK
ncbi:MAG: nucleotidyltransferase [Candidatus Aerophobetes bacterium]|nr:nucleotidyltransferase [Candidatus Aerophobetes bacterium]